MKKKMDKMDCSSNWHMWHHLKAGLAVVALGVYFLGNIYAWSASWNLIWAWVLVGLGALIVIKSFLIKSCHM